MERELTRDEIRAIARDLAPGGVKAMLWLYDAPVPIDNMDGRLLRSPKRHGLVKRFRSVWMLTPKGQQVAGQL